MSDNIHVVDPGNYKKCDTLYAYLSEDEDGNEGILGASINGAMIPLVFGDHRLLVRFVEYAIAAKASGKKIKAVSFSNPQVLFDTEGWDD